MKLFISLLLVISHWISCFATDVSFDGRSFMINGERKLFISGSVHYPRAGRSEWPGIFAKAKENGINLIQTYVFWDIHEPTQDEFNFPTSPSSPEDLVAFVQEAQKQDLYVNLRISGYVCAEWNFGGLPVWLRKVGTLRTMDDGWLKEFKEFMEKTIDVVKSANLLAGDGGPIVMLQMENEYGNMEDYYGADGHKYVQWVSDYAKTLDTRGVPWIMCQQGEGVGTAPSADIINTCNGFYCDNWISRHAKDFPNQPHMFTENWPGWFQNWGQAVPHRPATDVAFSVARWFARGGSYMNYYMAFGGTNFGRTVGGPLIITSYDYDVQINEYAMNAEPKFSLTQGLHQVLMGAESLLLSQAVPDTVPLVGSSSCESHTYANAASNQCIAFLSNWGTLKSCSFPVGSGAAAATVEVPAWSVSIVRGANCTEEVYNTKKSVLQAQPNALVATSLNAKLGPVESIAEKIPSRLGEADIAAPVVKAEWPKEQLSVTEDKSDYLWYSTKVPAGTVSPSASSAALKYMIGTAGGGVMFVYVDGKLVASTLGPSAQGLEPLGDEDSEVALTIDVPAGGAAFDLDILSISMGLKNYGPFLETIRVGITSNVTVDGVVVSGFTHSNGLQGEVRGIASSPAGSKIGAGVDACSGGLCWHKTTFSTPASVGADSHLALDLGLSMGKGAAWVNGKMLGRYWNIPAQAAWASCQACDEYSYVGAYGPERCRTGCGEPSQSYYKLPTDWLHSAESGEANSLVIFEEVGGSPLDVQLVELSMGPAKSPSAVMGVGAAYVSEPKKSKVGFQGWTFLK